MIEIKIRKLDEDSFIVLVDDNIHGTFHKTEQKDMFFNVINLTKKLQSPQTLANLIEAHERWKQQKP